MQAGASVLQKFAYAASASAAQPILPLAGKRHVACEQPVGYRVSHDAIRQSAQTEPLSRDDLLFFYPLSGLARRPLKLLVTQDVGDLFIVHVAGNVVGDGFRDSNYFGVRGDRPPSRGTSYVWRDMMRHSGPVATRCASSG